MDIYAAVKNRMLQLLGERKMPIHNPATELPFTTRLLFWKLLAFRILLCYDKVALKEKSKGDSL